MRRIILWKGGHSSEVLKIIQSAWENEDCLILFPPKVDDLSFVEFLPEGQVEFFGDWDSSLLINISQKRNRPIYPENPIFGIFSTGSLSRKLVLYSRKNVESSLAGILGLFQSQQYEAVFCYPQPFHTFGLILGYLHALLYKKRFICLEGAYTEGHHEAWLNVTSGSLMTLGTPTHFKDLIAYCAKKGVKPRSSYAAIIGAARVDVSLWKDLKEKLGIVYPSIGYGATEASPGVSHLPPGREPKEDGEVGFPLKHLQTHLFPSGGVEFSGASVCLAMIENNNLEFPTRILIRDRVEQRADGVWIYKGRCDLLLNRGGEKFNLEEMELLLKQRLDVDSLCMPIPSERLGEELGILVAKNINIKGQIYTVLKEKYGREFDSKYFQSVEELPLNASSKLDRKAALSIVEGHA